MFKRSNNNNPTSSTAPASLEQQGEEAGAQATGNDVAAANASGTTEANGSPSVGSAEQGSEVGEPVTAANAGTATNGVSGTSSSDSDPALSDNAVAGQQFGQAVYDDIVKEPASNTLPDHQLLAAIKAYRQAAEVRFEHLITGMANSTAEALRCLADAEIHLADHIAQQETAKS